MSDLRPRSSRSSTTTGIARHGRLKKSNPWGALLGLLAGAVAVVLVASFGLTTYAATHLVNNVAAVNIHPGEKVAPPPTIGAYPGGFNMLIVGSDTRIGQGGIGAGVGETGGGLNDVTMLLHVSGDHTNATAVSIPRDMVVPMPACSKGGPASALPINNTLSYGGLPCVVKTVEALTGLTIQFAGMITFKGVIEMSNAVGGVRVCVTGKINDTNVGLHLDPGYTVLKGDEALKFLRSRHGVGDGSDLGRISSQQVYLSSLVRKLKSADTLSNFGTLYKLASAATSNMELSTSLKSLDTMLAIAQALKSVPLDRVVFVQYPGTTGAGGVYAGKVAPITSQADELFALIKADKPIAVSNASSRGSVPDPNKHPADPAPGATSTATPGPTSAAEKPATLLDGVIGQSAADYTCSKANN